MMSTTTIRLSDELKTRVARAARVAGTTPHGFILDAIAEKAEAEERMHAFHALAEQRYAAIVRTGRTLSWKSMRDYLEKRTGGRKVARPSSGKRARTD